MKTRKLICALSAIFLAIWPLAITHAGPALTTIATFNPALGELPENLVIDHRGNIYMNMAPTGEIRKIAPDGTQSTLARSCSSPILPCSPSWPAGPRIPA